MNESQVRKLFFVIQNSYDFFDDNDDKVLLWMKILEHTPFEVADRNLFEYIGNPENKKPPHPGVLTKVIQGDRDRYVPGVAETRLMLENQPVINAVPPTEEQRERVRRIVGD